MTPQVHGSGHLTHGKQHILSAFQEEDWLENRLNRRILNKKKLNNFPRC